MQPRTNPSAARAAEDHSAWLAPVVSLARARQRRATIQQRPRGGAPSRHRDLLGAWVGQFLDATLKDGCVLRTAMTSVATWRDLIDSASRHSQVLDDTDTGRRVMITPSGPAQFGAIEKACTLLTNLGAQPRLDVELSLAPDYLHLTLRGVLADPVMTPDIADDLTETLRTTTPGHWTLDVTDTGALRWHTATPYGAVAP